MHTVEPLRPASLPAVIAKPAEFAGLALDPGLVEEMVADTGSGDALPLLAFTLERLATDVPRGGRLTLERYRQLGRVQGALAEHAEEALTEAVRAGGRTRDAVIQELLRLVVLDEQLRPTRWRVPWADLDESAATELDQFVERRLLITETEGDRKLVGVAHEAFLTEWGPLDAAIDARSTALRAKRRIEQATLEWTAGTERPGLLWDGAQLAGAAADVQARLEGGRLGRRTTLVTDEIGLSAPAREFLQASMLRERRNRRRTIAVLSALLLLVSVGAGVAVWQWRIATDQHRLAVAQQLLTQADLTRTTDTRAALRLAIAAQQISPGVGANPNLLTTLSSTRYARTLQSSDMIRLAGLCTERNHSLATGGGDVE